MTYRNKNGFCAILGGGFLDIETLVVSRRNPLRNLKRRALSATRLIRATSGKRLYLAEKSRNLRPEMKRIGYRLNEFLLKDFNADESALVMRNLRRIALNASEISSRIFKQEAYVLSIGKEPINFVF